jgi:hypothetical protein
MIPKMGRDSQGSTLVMFFKFIYCFIYVLICRSEYIYCFIYTF